MRDKVTVGASKGYDKLPDSEVPKRRTYKRDQMQDAHLLGNDALQEYENPDGSLEGTGIGGFLPRNNYGDRF